MSDLMANIHTFRMPFQTTHFNDRQKVFVAVFTGQAAALCYGRFRGRGRYVHAWVDWKALNRASPQFQTIDVADDFAARVSRI